MSARTNRQRCWDNRDAYYMCLTKHSIVAPPGTDMSDIKGALGRGQFAELPRTEAERVRLAAEERAHDPCTHERDAYEGSCAHSWVCFFPKLLTQIEYFNKRRVLDERQKKFYAEAEARVTRS